MKFEECRVGQRIQWHSRYTGLKKGEIKGVNPHNQAVVVLWDGVDAESKYIDTVEQFQLEGTKPGKEFRVGQRIQWKEEGLVGVITEIEGEGVNCCLHVKWDGDKRSYPYQTRINQFEVVGSEAEKSTDRLYSFFATPRKGNCPCDIPPPCKYHPNHK